MISSDKQILLNGFRDSFSSIDQDLHSYEMTISKLAELANVTIMLNVFLKRYEGVLDDTEKEILKQRIDSGIDKLVKSEEKDMRTLWYFERNFQKNPDETEFYSRNLMVSVRGLFELAPVSRIPLDSTVWSYFIDQISLFVHQLTKTVGSATGEMRGRLSFLLVIVIHSLASILKALSAASGSSKV
jgi:hypothetical protein